MGHIITVIQAIAAGLESQHTGYPMAAYRYAALVIYRRLTPDARQVLLSGTVRSERMLHDVINYDSSQNTILEVFHTLTKARSES